MTRPKKPRAAATPSRSGCRRALPTSSLNNNSAERPFAMLQLPGHEQWCAADYMCSNHTQNLPATAFNRVFDDWLAERQAWSVALRLSLGAPMGV
jgi:hypothetical protein